MSGGPCFRIIPTENRIELAAIIYEGRWDMGIVFARQLSPIDASGHIAPMPPGATLKKREKDSAAFNSSGFSRMLPMASYREASASSIQRLHANRTESRSLENPRLIGLVGVISRRPDMLADAALPEDVLVAITTIDKYLSTVPETDGRPLPSRAIRSILFDTHRVLRQASFTVPHRRRAWL